jgi:arylformamidase
MQDTAQEKIYNGWTADELAVELDVEKTIPDLPSFQQEGGKMSAATRAKLGGVIDIAYGNEPLQTLDVFAPDGAKDAPVIFYIHGGGWRAGSKNGYSFPAETMNEAGILWVPIDYGLAPDYTVDQIVDHVRSAFAWVYGNIREHGGDPDQIYVLGNSAGGHLTGTLLMSGWHGEYAVPGNAIKGACAMSGVFDMEALVHAAYGYNNELQMDLKSARAHSPLFHIPQELPPIVIGYGGPELEGFRKQSRDFALALHDGGHDVTEIAVPNTDHFAMGRQIAISGSEINQAVLNMVGKG